MCDLLEFLSARGWRMECDYLDENPGRGKRIYRIPAAVNRAMSLECPGNIRAGSWLVRVPSILQRVGGDQTGSAEDVFGEETGSDRSASSLEIRFSKKRGIVFAPDIVLVNFAYLADALPNKRAIGEASRPLPVTCILAHDVLHKRVESFASLGLSNAWSKWTRERETALLRRADIIVAISQTEADTFREMCPSAQIIAAPMSAQPKRPLGAQVPGRCLFVGGGDAHNVHGLKWFLGEVWPIVIQQFPSATLHVCGSVCEEIPGGYANVALLGHVANLAGEYGATQVSVVPVLAGSGVKIKLIEAMAYGRACVTTREGLKGVEFIGEAVTLADTPQEFASAILSLLRDEGQRKKAEHLSSRMALERLSPSQSYEPFARMVEGTVSARKQNGSQ